MKTHRNRRTIARNLLLAGLLAGGAAFVPSIVAAGECPSDKVGANALKDAATAPAGVTDMVLTSIDLSTEALKLNDRLFRLRRLEVQPNGIVPMHSHGDRPALIYIVSGSITEYSSNCTVPILHEAGEAAMESIGLTHWWKNTGSEVAVLLSADLFHSEMDDGHMM